MTPAVPPPAEQTLPTSLSAVPGTLFLAPVTPQVASGPEAPQPAAAGLDAEELAGSEEHGETGRFSPEHALSQMFDAIVTGSVQLGAQQEVCGRATEPQASEELTVSRASGTESFGGTSTKPRRSKPTQLEGVDGLEDGVPGVVGSVIVASCKSILRSKNSGSVTNRVRRTSFTDLDDAATDNDRGFSSADDAEADELAEAEDDDDAPEAVAGRGQTLPHRRSPTSPRQRVARGRTTGSSEMPSTKSSRRRLSTITPATASTSMPSTRRVAITGSPTSQRHGSDGGSPRSSRSTGGWRRTLDDPTAAKDRAINRKTAPIMFSRASRLYDSSDDPGDAATVSAPVSSSSSGRMTIRGGRLADPQARLAFLKEHPFFENTSRAFREKLAPELVQRSSGSMKERTTLRSESGVRLLEQGLEPDLRTDYLFLLTPDNVAKPEVLFDGRPVATLGGGCAFGQEVTLGIASRFLFEVTVSFPTTSAAKSLWVVPNVIVQTLLSKDAHKSDALMLKQRAYDAAASMLHAAVLHPACPLRVRLFESTAHAFRLALAEAVETELHTAGSRISQQGDREGSCMCLFRGEATARTKGGAAGLTSRTVRAASGKAWTAWWGLLEAMSACDRSLEEVVAVTDCVVWRLRREPLEELRGHFPKECQLLDMAALELCRVVRSSAMRISESPIFAGADQDFVFELERELEPRTYPAGHVVVHEHDPGDCLFFLARGHMSARRMMGRHAPRTSKTMNDLADVHQKHPVGVVLLRTDSSPGEVSCRSVPPKSEEVEVLSQGDWFGELVPLGYAHTRNATVVCNTICDLRALKGEAVAEALAKSPEQAEAFLKLAESHGRPRYQMPREGLRSLSFLDGFSAQFVHRLALELQQAAWFKGQVVMRQRTECDLFYVLMSGKVGLEIDGATIGELEGPSFLGEMALVQEGFKSTATVRSRAVCHALTCKIDKAQWLLRQHPEDQGCMRKLAETNQEDLRTILLRRFDLQRVLFRGNEEGDEIGSRKSEEIADGNEQDDGEADPDVVERRRTTMTQYLMKTVLYGGDEQFVRFLAQYMEPQVYFDGQVLLLEGDAGDFALLLHEGLATVEVGGVRVGEVHSGTVVGEMAMMGRSERRTATVRACGVATASRIPRSMVLLAFEKFPQEKKRMEKTLEVRAKTNQMLTRSDNVLSPHRTQTQAIAENALKRSELTTPGNGGRECSKSRSRQLMEQAVFAAKHRNTARTFAESEEESALAQMPQYQARLWNKVKYVKHAATATRHASIAVQARHASIMSIAPARPRAHRTAGEPAELEADSGASADSQEEVEAAEDPSSADSADAFEPPRQGLAAVDEEDAAAGTKRAEAEPPSPKTALWPTRGKRWRRAAPTSAALPALDAPGGRDAAADAAAARPRQPSRQPSKQPVESALGSSFLPLVPAPPPQAAKGEQRWQLVGPRRLRKAEGLYGAPVWHEVFGRTLR